MSVTKKILLSTVFLILYSCSTNVKKTLQIDNDTCLLFFKSEYNTKEWSCSGSFVDDKTLITAAHCGEAFNNSDFQLDYKNTVSGYCKINNKLFEVHPNLFLVHPKYSFNDISTRGYDIALLKVKDNLDITLSSQLTTDPVLIKNLIQKNKCFIAGYKDTLSTEENQNTIVTPKSLIYLESINKEGIRYQTEFDLNKGVVYGGVAEKKLKITNTESSPSRYPGPGYSGSSLVCSDDEIFYKVGIFVGGFESSNTWVSLLFLDDIASWLSLSH